MSERAPVAIIMGSRSDWPTMKGAADMLEALGVGYETAIVSAHRTPERLYAFARGARGEGFKVIIAGAGGAAHLPGMTASLTDLPVLGVPVTSNGLNGLDALLSIVQMPAGIPVGALAIGVPGARNAGLMAARILALGDPALAERVAAHRLALAEAVPMTVEGP
jgi:5-(carboxyamino)imidazole ribonucleotide mutase